MYSLEEILGKKIIDGSGIEIGVLDGLNLTYFEYRIPEVYLRVEGGRLIDIRGRKREFIPSEEIDVLGEEIQLYKDFNSLAKVIKGVDFKDHDTYRGMELIGLKVTSSDRRELGIVSDIVLGRKYKDVFLMIEGKTIKDIRGNMNEKVSFSDVMEIKSGEILIDLEYDALKQRIREE